MMATVLLTACGDDSGSGQTAGTESSAAQGAPQIDPTAPVSKQLAQVFPVPKPGPGSLPGAAAAIAAGRKACEGKTPMQVREEFIGAAQGLSDEQEAMIDELPKYEKQAVTSNFVAGQLAAGVYEATLPDKKAIAGYQGCVYELALQVRRELAKKQGYGPGFERT
jgi:hypothetical protein